MKLVFEAGRNFSAFLAARMVFVTVLLGVAALYSDDRRDLIKLSSLFLANTTLSMGCAEWHRRGKTPRLALWVAFTAAVCIDTLVLQWSVRTGSDFTFLYFFSVAAAGVLIGLAGSLWTALLSTSALAFMLFDATAGMDALYLIRLLGLWLALTVVSLLSSYVHDRVQQSERRHKATLGELEQARIDTQAIIDSLSTGLVVIGKDGTVMYTNPAGMEILGLSRESAPEDVIRRFNESSVDPLLFTDRLISANRRELEIQTAAGAKPVGFATSAIKDRSGAPRGHIILFSDLTLVKEAERLEREQERLAAIGRLSSDLAHGIRNPLATVRGCAEMLPLTGPVTAEQKRYVDLALKESDRLNTLLADFLNFAQLQSPRKAPGDLVELIRIRIERSQAKVAIVDKLRGEAIVQFDTDQMSMVIDILLLTLSEWAEGAGMLQVENQRDTPESVRFRLPELVLTEAQVKEVFRPFSESARSANGLALPTAMRTVHAHGGTLRVESKAQVGTYFELVL